MFYLSPSLLIGPESDGTAEAVVRLLSSKDLTDRFGSLFSRLFVNLLSSLAQPESFGQRSISAIAALLDSFGEALFMSPNGKDSIETLPFLVALKSLITIDLELAELASTILLVALSGSILLICLLL